MRISIKSKFRTRARKLNANSPALSTMLTAFLVIGTIVTCYCVVSSNSQEIRTLDSGAMQKTWPKVGCNAEHANYEQIDKRAERSKSNDDDDDEPTNWSANWPKSSPKIGKCISLLTFKFKFTFWNDTSEHRCVCVHLPHRQQVQCNAHWTSLNALAVAGFASKAAKQTPLKLKLPIVCEMSDVRFAFDDSELAAQRDSAREGQRPKDSFRLDAIQLKRILSLLFGPFQVGWLWGAAVAGTFFWPSSSSAVSFHSRPSLRVGAIDAATTTFLRARRLGEKSLFLLAADLRRRRRRRFIRVSGGRRATG